MPNSISIPEIVKLCHKGISLSFRRYYNIAGEWLNSAPEFFISTNIFYSLARESSHFTHYVTLEDNRGEVVDGAGGIEEDNKKEDMRLNGKVDIIIWHSTIKNNKNKPKAIIEVKNNVIGFSKIENDINTIISIIGGMSDSGQPPIRLGVIAGYLDKCSNSNKGCRQRVEDALRDIQHKTKVFSDNCMNGGVKMRIKLYVSKIHYVKSEDSAWASIVITIQPPSKKL